MRAFVLTQRKQMLAASGLAAAALWMGVCTAAMLISLIERSGAAERLAATQASYAWVAAPKAASQADASTTALAALIERRHAALALLLTDARGTPGAAQALAPPIARGIETAAATTDPLRRLQAVQASQEQLVAAADTLARERAERLRKALRLAGVTPGAVHRSPVVATADLGQDADFAARFQQAAADLSEADGLDATAQRLPLARPTHDTAQSSGFGVRMDPFTRHAAFHPGLDFPGPRMTPVYATAPGRVSFTGVRSGYGETVEVDHGQGVKTRYAHLARIGVRAGQHVEVGAPLGGMGSTGRSTGTHLHYEVWVNGRVQNPARFVRAGAYVLQGAG